MKDYYDAAVLGGGIFGLAVAYNLSKKGKTVLVIEKEKELGGALKSIKRPSYIIEEFYHHIFTDNPLTIKLIKELGLGKKLKFYPSKPAFIYKDETVELSTALDVLRFRKLSFLNRIRMGLFLARIITINDYRKYDNIKAHKFIISTAGRSVYEKFFRQMLIGKFGKDYKNISAAWFIARLKYRSKRVKGFERLGYLDNGFGTLVYELVNRMVKDKRIEILTSGSINNIGIENNQIKSIKVKNNTARIKHLVSSIPLESLYKLGKFEELKNTGELSYQGAIVVVLGTKKRITKHYWNTIEITGKKVRAIIEHTNLVSPKHYKEHIIYLASYPSVDENIWKMNDKEILKLYLADIKSHTEIDTEDVSWFSISRLKPAGLIYETNILSLLPSSLSVRNVHIGGMLTQFPERGIENSIKEADEISKTICQNE